MSTSPPPGPEVEPKPWQTGLAPVYIGAFLWIAYFDQIGRRALPLGGLGCSILGALIGGPLAYLLLFRPSGLWGHRVGKPLHVISTSTFGIKGAMLIPGLLIGFAQVLLYAVAVGYAVELTFQGLVLVGLVEPSALQPIRMGAATLKSPLYLWTALVWSILTALISLRFTRWIAYLMQYFPVFPALAIGGATMAMMVGLRTFRPSGIDPAMPSVIVPPLEAALRATLLTLQWVFAFSAMGGIMGADWGSGSLATKDVKIGGWVGLGLAPAIITALGLISVAGYEGSKVAASDAEEPRLTRSTIRELPPLGARNLASPRPGLDAPPFTFRAVANGGFGRYVGGVILMVFGLASLAPAVYSSFTFGLQFKTAGPGIATWIWTMMGACAAWLLIVGGWFDRTEVAFNLLGAVFAPIAGAVAADYRRHKGEWPGPRNGVNQAGLIAWLVGLVVGLAPVLGRFVGSDRMAQFQPAALAAFVAAYLVYEVLARLGAESASAIHGWAVHE